MEKIKNVYIVNDKDKNNHEYISKILIEYTDKKIDYYLNKAVDSDNISEKRKQEKYMRSTARNILRNIKPNEKDKIYMITDKDKLVRRHVDKVIELEEQKKANNSETREAGYICLSLVEAFLSTLEIIKLPVFLNVGGIGSAVAAALANNERKGMKKQEPEWLRKLKFGLSMMLLSANIYTGIGNLSVDLDIFPTQKYKLENQMDENILNPHQIIVNDLENPFKGENMVTSSDAAVNLLMEAFDLNPLIEETDREIGKNLRQYIKENPYFNYEKCYEDFASFNIVREHEKKSGINNYNYGSDSSIEIDTTSTMNYNNVLERGLVHYTGKLENKMLDEGMTTLICSEYMDGFAFDKDHQDELFVTNIFCELITPEKMLEAFSTSNMGIIAEEFKNMGIDSSKYQSLMDLINNYSLRMNECKNSKEKNNFRNQNSNEFRQNLTNYIVDILPNANLSQDQQQRVLSYLSHIGEEVQLMGVIYLNKEVNIPNTVKAYSTQDKDAMSLESRSYS